MLKIKLSNEIVAKIKTGYIKTIEVINFILSNVENTSTTKDINKTAIGDISFNGIYYKTGYFDTTQKMIILKK